MPKENKDMKKAPKSFILVALSILLTGCNTTSSTISESSSLIEPKTYKVTWKNYDGSILEVDEKVTEGDTPTYDGTTPLRAETAQYSYIFSGWSPEVTPANGNAEYTATFKEETKKYTVTWKNYDGSVLKTEEVLYGTVPNYTGDTPTKDSTVEHTYTFEKWSPNVVAVTENTSYVASFKEEARKYNVTWKNDDGSTLRVDQVAYGDTPNYGENNPSKDNTAQYAYAFDKWVPNISSVTGDMEYTASYTSEVRKYTITWVNEDGTVLEIDENVPYGTIPSYNSATPTKDGIRGVDYIFDGWDTGVEFVKADKTYTATFKEKGYFSFAPIEYETKNGYTLDDINGAPWINSNIEGEIDKIRKPSLKDDFFASINYERIQENGGSAFTAAQNAVRSVISQIYYDQNIASKTTNGIAIQTIHQKVLNGDAQTIATYLNDIDVETYINSKECFVSEGSVLRIEPYQDAYLVEFNDGYISSGNDTLPFLLNYGRTAQMGKTILGLLSDALDFGFTTSDINEVYTFDYELCDIALADYYRYGSELVTYSVSDVPWEPMKNALLDMGFSGKQQIHFFKLYENCLNAFYNNYFVNQKDTIKKDIMSRLAFDYRYFVGIETYKDINRYLSNWSDFFPYESGLYGDDDQRVAMVIAQICMPIVMQQAYIELGSSQEIKNQVTALINEILDAYKVMAESTWLGEQTKQAMIKKLNYMGYASCYSDEHKNFTKFTDDNTPNKSAFEVFKAYTETEIDVMGAGNADKDHFFDYYPCYTVNAFYSPRSNDIIILNGLAAGMLGDSIEEKYAMLGTVVGHEITHAFDTDGSLYDENGQLNNWWTDADRKTFENKVDKLIKFYKKIDLKKGYKVDGLNVSQEATADLGGLKIILQIVKKYDYFDYDKFFRTYAYLWCCYTHSIDLVESYNKEDGHPYNYLRCNVTISQFDEFIETYGIKPGDGMYVPEEERIRIW